MSLDDGVVFPARVPSACLLLSDIKKRDVYVPTKTFIINRLKECLLLIHETDERILIKLDKKRSHT